MTQPVGNKHARVVSFMCGGRGYHYPLRLDVSIGAALPPFIAFERLYDRRCHRKVGKHIPLRFAQMRVEVSLVCWPHFIAVGKLRPSVASDHSQYASLRATTRSDGSRPLQFGGFGRAITCP